MHEMPDAQRVDTPRWWQRGIVYQIYPRSFMDADGDGIGDLPGIVARLDYLAWLGVDAVWVSPFYPSPMADFGYDVSDHTAVHPMFGTLDDFDRLVAAAHERGLRVIVDFVPNHTSDRHPWFAASRASRDDPKRGWYVWRDPAPDGGPPPGAGSRHTNQSRRGLSRDDRDSTNHGCSLETWLGTKSTSTRRPRACARSTSRSKSSSVPNIGWTAVWSDTS